MADEDGSEVTVFTTTDGIWLQWNSGVEFFRVLLTQSEAVDLASALVKHAMPDAKPDTAPVSIM